MDQNSKSTEPSNAPLQHDAKPTKATPPSSEEWKEQAEPIKNNDQDAGRENRTGNHHSTDAA